MPYVERQDGKVTGLYERSQPGLAEELLADDNPEVLAFEAAPEVEEQERAARQDMITGTPGYDELVNMLKTATPGQWDTYLTNNMTTLAQARQVIYKMGLALMAIARSLP